MRYKDTWDIDEVSRKDIETLYSIGHSDGVGTGLVRYEGRILFAERVCNLFDGVPNHKGYYWLIGLTQEQQDYAIKYCEAWAQHFHSGMTWNPDGTRPPETIGNYGYKSGGNTRIQPHGHEVFRSRYPSVPAPLEDAEVVGYFRGWRLGLY